MGQKHPADHPRSVGGDNFKRYYVDQGMPVEALMEWETQGWLAGYGV